MTIGEAVWMVYSRSIVLVFLLDRGFFFEQEPQNCCITPYSGPIEPKSGLQAESLMMTYSRTPLPIVIPQPQFVFILFLV